MVKYVGNAFSPAMINDNEGKITLTIDTITKNQFMKACTKAKSIIGHPELSELFNVKLNRESVTLKKGDILYVVSPKRRYKEGEIVKYGDIYEKLSVDKDFVYRQIQVLDK